MARKRFLKKLVFITGVTVIVAGATWGAKKIKENLNPKDHGLLYC